jgi:hypothetical protein
MMDLRSPVLLAIMALIGCAQPAGQLADGSPVYGRSFMPDDDDGLVTVNCRAGEQGVLEDCRIVEETPEGLGLGDLALETAAKARLRPDGVAIGGRFEFTLRIQLD